MKCNYLFAIEGACNNGSSFRKYFIMLTASIEFWLLPQPVAKRMYDPHVFLFSVMTISKSRITVSNMAVSDVAGSGCDQHEIYLPYMHITEGITRSPDQVDFI
jgi:hypothetical protein